MVLGHLFSEAARQQLDPEAGPTTSRLVLTWEAAAEAAASAAATHAAAHAAKKVLHAAAAAATEWAAAAKHLQMVRCGYLQ